MIARLRQAAWPIGVGMAGVAVYVLLQVTKPQPAPSIEPPRPIRVEVVPAIRATTRPTVVAYGEVRPGVRTQLVAQVGGEITQVAPAFIEGGQFDAGDVLLTIEDTDYRAAVDERQARVAAAKVDLEQALADADVARKQLAGQKNPSRDVVGSGADESGAHPNQPAFRWPGRESVGRSRSICEPR